MSKIQVFGHFLGNRSLKVSIFGTMVEGNRGNHLSVESYFGKILIRGLRVIKCQKFVFFEIFSETGH